MQNVTSGSRKEKKESRGIGPFGKAAEGAMNLAMGMTTCYTFQTIANRIEVLEAIMSLPIVISGSSTRHRRYQDELDDIEKAINVFCTFGEPPEA